MHIKNVTIRTSLVVQWLSLCTAYAGGVCSISCQVAKIPRASVAWPKKMHYNNLFFLFREDLRISQNAHDIKFYHGGYITMYGMIPSLLQKKKITHSYTWLEGGRWKEMYLGSGIMSDLTFSFIFKWVFQFFYKKYGFTVITDYLCACITIYFKAWFVLNWKPGF